MKVLIPCEFSGIVRDAFIARGHDAMSCDLIPTERPGPHYQGDAMDLIDEDWDLMIAHPPCTYFTRAGQRWLKGESMEYVNKYGLTIYRGARRVRALRAAARFFNAFKEATHIPLRAIENPRPGSHALPLIGRPTQYIQPWMFGHGETKETGLWLYGLPPLVPTNIVEGRDNRVHQMRPSKTRAKDRSEFYPGIAAAMADQWGCVTALALQNIA
jgi:hypothetical protein